MNATTIKRCAWVLAAVWALSAALAVLLPGGIAEAQSLDDGAATVSPLPGSDTQVQDNAAMSQQQQPAYEPATLWVVNPGDSLWAIGQQRLQPNPTAEQTMNEVGRIYELNRDLIGDDPNLIFPGQELLLPEVYKPAAIAPAVSRGVGPEQASEVAVSGQVPEEAAQERVLEPDSEMGAPSDLPVSKEAVPTEAETDESSSVPYINQPKLLGLGILVLTVCVAILILWRLLAGRNKTSSPSVVGGQVYVSVDGGQEQFIAQGAEGTVYVPEIRGGKQYEFRLYSGTDRTRLLDTVTVTRSEDASLTATPNPVPAGIDKTTIIWSTGSGSEGQVYVSVDGGQEQFVAQGAEGYVDTPEIQPNATYEFRLYSGADRTRLLDTVTVTRSEKKLTSKETPNQDMQRDGAALTEIQNESERGKQVGAYISAAPNPLPASPGADTTKIIWSIGDRWSKDDLPEGTERGPEPSDEKVAYGRRLKTAPPRRRHQAPR